MEALLAACFVAVVGGMITLFTNGMNADATKKQNDKNIAMQEKINQANLDYAASTTQQQWERDDTAHQREVSDLEAAGLSPLSSLGGQMNTPAQVSGPFNHSAQYVAPQVDTNSILQSVLGAGDMFSRAGELKNKIDTLNFEKAKHGDDVAFKTIELEQAQETINQGWKEIENVTKELNIQDKKVNAEIDSINNSIQIAKDTLAEQIAHNQEIEDREYENNRYIRINERIIKELPDGMRYQACFDDKTYQSAWESFLAEYKSSLEEVFGSESAKNMPIMNPNEDSNLTSWSASGTGGVTVMGTGGNITAGANYSRDISKTQLEQWNKRLRSLRFPLRFSTEDKDLFDDDGVLKSYSKKNNYRD